MNAEIERASKILFDLVVAVEPKMATLASWYRTMIEKTDQWYRSEGNQGIKRSKDVLSQAWLAVLGEDTQQLDYVATEGTIPVIVQPLVSRVNALQKTPRLMSAVLSVVRLPDLWKGIISDKTVNQSLDVITASKLPQSAHKIISEFETFVSDFFAQYPESPQAKAWRQPFHLTESSQDFYRESKGPNGPLTESAHLDLMTLENCHTSDGNTLNKSIEALEAAICSEADFSFHPSTSYKDKVLSSSAYLEDGISYSDTPGKLTMIPEKAGKVRIVAQPDYYSQLAMRPVHQWLMDLIKSFPADCTFDQKAAIPKIAEWQGEGGIIYSFDQSSCTDLFPFECQLKLLSDRFGSPVTEAVRTVMSDRDWKVKLPSGRVRKIRWSVGQPMGMFGSWPLMAASHHLIVQFAYWKSTGHKFKKNKPYDRYVICGDDICIADRSVAESYISIVRKLGMKINLSKSHISGGSTNIPPVSEFAKVIIWKSQPLTPIRPNMVLSSVKDWRYAVPLFQDLKTSTCFNMKLHKVKEIVKKHYTSGYRFLNPLLTIPDQFGGVGYRGSDSLRQKVDCLEIGEIHPLIWFLALKVRAGLKQEQKVFTALEGTTIPNEIWRGHPLQQVTSRMEREIAYIDLARAFDRVPSTLEIVESILRGGFGPYSRFITETVAPPLPVWANGQEPAYKLKMRSMWQVVLSKHPKLPLKTAKSIIYDGVMDTYGSHEIVSIFLDDPEHDWYHDLQYNIVSTAMTVSSI